MTLKGLQSSGRTGAVLNNSISSSQIWVLGGSGLEVTESFVKRFCGVKTIKLRHWVSKSNLDQINKTAKNS